MTVVWQPVLIRGSWAEHRHVDHPTTRPVGTGKRGVAIAARLPTAAVTGRLALVDDPQRGRPLVTVVLDDTGRLEVGAAGHVLDGEPDEVILIEVVQIVLDPGRVDL